MADEIRRSNNLTS